MPQKPKLTIPEQIAYMRDQCGIAFSRCSEDEAAAFLSQRNYFFKVKSFAKNYAKDASGKYFDLDFAYLQELSILDALLRKQILAIALDVEHFLKVGLMAEISQNDAEDGYALVQHFFAKYPRIPQELRAKAHNSYCNDLVTKMDAEGYAVWNAIEVLSFGQFIQLYKLYSAENGRWNSRICNLLIPAKSIRNAAAHNNCILNSLQTPYSTPKPNMTRQIESFVSRVPELKKSKSRKTKLANPVIHDFVALLFLFDRVCTSPSAKKRVYAGLTDLLEGRFQQHSDYFQQNAVLVSSYEFVRKIVHFLQENQA